MFKENKNFLSFILVIIFLAAGFFLVQRSSVPTSKNVITNVEPKTIRYVRIGGESVKVELASTPQEQAQGLSGRNGLEENEGMLFVFARPDRYSFWMKDMKFPLDMIWINEEMEVVYIKKNARPESYPESYGPKENASYVLEVASGFSDRNDLKVGDRVEFLFN